MTTTSPPQRTKPGVVRQFFHTLSRQPGLDYLMLRLAIFSIIALGLLMAFSSTMVVSAALSSPWDLALRQTLMVSAGLMVFVLALFLPMRIIRAGIPALLALAILLLILVLTPLGTGREQVGSQSWLALGPLMLQPSELARVAIALFAAYFLAGHRGKDLRRRMVYFCLIAAAMMGLILAQGDVGMAMSFAMVVGFSLLFAGLNLSAIMVLAAGAALGVFLLFIFRSSGFRSQRFSTYFDALVGDFSDTQGAAFQTHQGYLSLAEGGLSGVGIGQSRAKWFYLPEARNDFVFAIIGEELGLWGGVLVILLFATLGFFGMRTAMRAQSHFQALAAASLTAAVVFQAFFNIGYVVGLLPVTGIQLPMISSGGTAAVLTIGAMGLLCSIARHEPEAISAMQASGRPLFDRLLRLPEPRPLAEYEPAPVPRRGRHAQPQQPRRNPPSGSRRQPASPGRAPHSGAFEPQRAPRGGAVEPGRAPRSGAPVSQRAPRGGAHARERYERFGPPLTGRGTPSRSSSRW